MEQKKTQEAVSAYTKFLETKGVKGEALDIRTKFVGKLITLLDGQANRSNYASALQTIIKIEDNIDRQQQLNYAREFYPFWMGDIKSIARISQTYGFDLDSAKFKSLPASLTWLEIDALNTDESFSAQENKLIRDYTLNLQQQNMSDTTRQEKIKLIKIMLLRLRDIPVEHSMAYRMAVDVTLPLFNLEDIKQGFLSAVREFYYIWLEEAKPNDIQGAQPA
ncbi:MAG: hypothetical protein ACSHWN_10700 [Methylophilaceae bacterium]